MKCDQLTVLLPCHSLESFDLQQNERDSEQLLAAWSALWHPLLVSSAGRLPRWAPAASPPPEPARHLIALPNCSEASLPEGWLTYAESDGALVLRGISSRNELVATALQRLDLDPTGVDPDLAADFLALGYCHLQIELLTHKLRYMSNLDESSLQDAVLAAADAVLNGDADAAREHLQTAFDRLHDAREYFYSTEARLLDLTLVARTTLGPALSAELNSSTPRNILISGELIDELARHEPSTLDTLKVALADNRAAILGGEYSEAPLPLLDPEAIQSELRRGIAAYKTHLDWRPTVFARRQFGLTPILPQVLNRNGFTAAVHCTLDDGRFPSESQSRIEWAGFDGSTIEAIGCVPLDASRASSFLRLAETLGNAMNVDHTATVVFAHWPGRVSPWYDDLQRTAAYGTLFGTFLTMTDYFQQTAMSGQRSDYQADQYRSPYLKQDVAAARRDPISRWSRYVRHRAIVQATETLTALATICNTSSTLPDAAPLNGQKDASATIDLESTLNADAMPAETADESAIEAQLTGSLQRAAVDFSRAIAGGAPSIGRGHLFANPWSFGQLLTADDSPLDVPALGFGWRDAALAPTVAPTHRRTWFRRRNSNEAPPLAHDNVLGNEFFEIRFDAQTGAIRAISDYTSRDPRLAQQIALREPNSSDPTADVNYTRMAVDELRVTVATPLIGEMFSRGRLLDNDGRRVAAFQQTTRVRRGNRTIELEIELDTDKLPGPNPWESYYAARFAWKDETASVHRSVNMADLPTDLKQFESPYFVDICRDSQRTAILTGGLPYHRRIGPRRLDTLLITRGESARKFRLGIALDAPNAMAAALSFVAPPAVLSNQPCPPTPTGWLFHLDCRNVLATHWEALSQTNSGFRVRLLETDGRGVRLGLRCFRPIASACKINDGDMPPLELIVEGDRINVPIGPHQWIEIEARFA